MSKRLKIASGDEYVATRDNDNREQKTSFRDIPAELLLLIAGHCDLKTAFALARVDRARWADCCEYLYTRALSGDGTRPEVYFRVNKLLSPDNLKTNGPYVRQTLQHMGDTEYSVYEAMVRHMFSEAWNKDSMDFKLQQERCRTLAFLQEKMKDRPRKLPYHVSTTLVGSVVSRSDVLLHLAWTHATYNHGTGGIWEKMSKRLLDFAQSSHRGGATLRNYCQMVFKHFFSSNPSCIPLFLGIVHEKYVETIEVTLKLERIRTNRIHDVFHPLSEAEMLAIMHETWTHMHKWRWGDDITKHVIYYLAMAYDWGRYSGVETFYSFLTTGPMKLAGSRAIFFIGPLIHIRFKTLGPEVHNEITEAVDIILKQTDGDRSLALKLLWYSVAAVEDIPCSILRQIRDARLGMKRVDFDQNMEHGFKIAIKIIRQQMRGLMHDVASKDVLHEHILRKGDNVDIAKRLYKTFVVDISEWDAKAEFVRTVDPKVWFTAPILDHWKEYFDSWLGKGHQELRHNFADLCMVLDQRQSEQPWLPQPYWDAYVEWMLARMFMCTFFGDHDYVSNEYRQFFLRNIAKFRAAGVSDTAREDFLNAFRLSMHNGYVGNAVTEHIKNMSRDDLHFLFSGDCDGKDPCAIKRFVLLCDGEEWANKDWLDLACSIGWNLTRKVPGPESEEKDLVALIQIARYDITRVRDIVAYERSLSGPIESPEYALNTLVGLFVSHYVPLTDEFRALASELVDFIRVNVSGEDRRKEFREFFMQLLIGETRMERLQFAIDCAQRLDISFEYEDPEYCTNLLYSASYGKRGHIIQLFKKIGMFSQQPARILANIFEMVDQESSEFSDDDVSDIFTMIPLTDRNAFEEFRDNVVRLSPHFDHCPYSLIRAVFSAISSWGHNEYMELLSPEERAYVFRAFQKR